MYIWNLITEIANKEFIQIKSNELCMNPAGVQEICMRFQLNQKASIFCVLFLSTCNEHNK